MGCPLLRVTLIWVSSNYNYKRPTSYLLPWRRIANGVADNWGVRLVHECLSLVDDAVVDCFLLKVEWCGWGAVIIKYQLIGALVTQANEMKYLLIPSLSASLAKIYRG